MEEENFIFESNKNPYQLTYEISNFAQRQIGIATDFLKEFLETPIVNVVAKRTYNINVPNGQIKVTSFKTEFLKNNNEKCTVEISNPFEFIGSIFWTHFTGKGAFWTNKTLLQEKNINSDIVFNLLSQNYEWVYRRVENIHISKLKNEEIDVKDNSLVNVLYSPDEYDEDYSPDIDYSPKVISTDEKEKIAYKVFKKVFSKK